MQTYTPLPTTTPLSVLAFPISHGSCACPEDHSPPRSYALRSKRSRASGKADGYALAGVVDEDASSKECLKTYETSAFFFKNEEGGETREFCFFGG